MTVLHACMYVVGQALILVELCLISRPAPPSLLCLSLFVCRGRRYALQE